jgi:hypothetical protein
VVLRYILTVVEGGDSSNPGRDLGFPGANPAPNPAPNPVPTLSQPWSIFPRQGNGQPLKSLGDRAMAEPGDM